VSTVCCCTFHISVGTHYIILLVTRPLQVSRSRLCSTQSASVKDDADLLDREASENRVERSMSAAIEM
jgi:hypothetical protein